MNAVNHLAKQSKRFWLLSSFILLVLLTGGGSRVDIQSLLFLLPVSVAVFSIALFSFRSDQITGWKPLFWFVFGLAVIAVGHVMPLPASIWQSLAGREELVEVEQLVGLSDVWRPLTITPMNGWHVVVSLFPILAVFFLATQLSRKELSKLLPLLLVFGALSGFVGLLQILGNPEGPLYFYRITNNGSAVGFFANRNHAAVFLACLFPMLSAYATIAQGTPESIRNRHLLALAAAVVLVPLILVTGSRTGLIVAVVGLVGAFAIYRPSSVRIERISKGARSRFKGGILAVSMVLAVAIATVVFSRAEAISRLFDSTAEASNRGSFWNASLDLMWKCFPWGCGSGSFVEVFQIIEPRSLIDSTYLNHAHNDWIETAVTFGVPGILALIAIVLYWISGVWKLLRQREASARTTSLNWMAAVIMAILGIASIFDYPLRTPTLQVLFILACLWLWDFRSDRTSVQTSDN